MWRPYLTQRTLTIGGYLLFDWYGFVQTSKALANSTQAKQLSANKINCRSAVQWYLPLSYFSLHDPPPSLPRRPRWTVCWRCCRFRAVCFKTKKTNTLQGFNFDPQEKLKFATQRKINLKCEGQGARSHTIAKLDRLCWLETFFHAVKTQQITEKPALVTVEVK